MSDFDLIERGALTAKLSRFAALTSDDQRALESLMSSNRRLYHAREDVMAEGNRIEHINVVLSGWACRHKQLEDGRRQIIAFLLPGDCCDHHILVVDRIDHTLSALTPATLARISRASLRSVIETSPRLNEAFLWEAESNASIAREWIVTLGQRDALERAAHLLCEIFYRLRAVGLADDKSCDLPVTQTDLADATGMTPVHLNRTLQELRSRKIISWNARRLMVPNLKELESIACFDPEYLHVSRKRDVRDV